MRVHKAINWVFVIHCNRVLQLTSWHGIQLGKAPLKLRIAASFGCQSARLLLPLRSLFAKKLHIARLQSCDTFDDVCIFSIVVHLLIIMLLKWIIFICPLLHERVTRMLLIIVARSHKIVKDLPEFFLRVEYTFLQFYPIFGQTELVDVALSMTHIWPFLLQH